MVQIEPKSQTNLADDSNNDFSGAQKRYYSVMPIIVHKLEHLNF